MTKDELLKDLWNSYSKSCDTPYRQWVKQGFDWMYGWHKSELKAKLLDKDIHREARERIFKRSNIALEKEKAELKAKADKLANFVEWFSTTKHGSQCGKGVCTCGVETAAMLIAEYRGKD